VVGVRVGGVVLVLVAVSAALAGCTQAVAGVAAPATGVDAPSAAPGGPAADADDPILGAEPVGGPVPGVIECPLVGIAQVGLTLQVDVQGGFPHAGRTPAQVSCEFGLGTAGQGDLRVAADGPATAARAASLRSRFAGGEQVAGVGDRAFYRTTGTGAELAVLTARTSIGLVLDSGADGPVSGDVRTKLVALARLVLARR
jgi:hypothetical protein